MNLITSMKGILSGHDKQQTYPLNRPIWGLTPAAGNQDASAVAMAFAAFSILIVPVLTTMS